SPEGRCSSRRSGSRRFRSPSAPPCSTTGSSSRTGRRSSCSRGAASSPGCSETSSLPRRSHNGLSRLTRYLGGHGWRVAYLSVIAVLGAGGPVIGLLLAQDAIDNGMKAGDTGRLTRDVVIYFAVNAAAWVLMSTMNRGLAHLGQGIVLDLREHLFEHLTS